MYDLPDWYKSWYMANQNRKIVAPEYVFEICNIRSRMFNILDNELSFCVTSDRNLMTRELLEQMNLLIKINNIFKVEHKIDNPVIKRTVCVGISGGSINDVYT